MGRKSSLTPEQWAQVEKKHFIDGASINSLAKAYGVDESAIRRKINPNKSEGKKVKKSLRDLALEKIEADKKSQAISEEVALLPISRQQTFGSLVQRLRNVSDEISCAAEYGAATAHRLAGMAHQRVAQIDISKPLDDKGMETLKGVAALTRLANDASQIAVSLIAANKDTMKKAGETPPETPAALINDPMEASRVYQELMART